MWFSAKEAHERKVRERYRQEREREVRAVNKVLIRLGITMSQDEIGLVLDGKPLARPLPSSPPPPPPAPLPPAPYRRRPRRSHCNCNCNCG